MVDLQIFLPGPRASCVERTGNRGETSVRATWHCGCDAPADVIVSFLGTKGGTGTSTVALCCALAVARLSERTTLLMEVKPGPGDLAVALGLQPRCSLADVLDHRGWLERGGAARCVTEYGSGVHVLPTGDAFGRPDASDVDALEETIANLSSAYEVVIVDAGSALSACAAAVVDLSDVVVLVATPDTASLRNVRRWSDALRVAGVVPERVRVLLNRATDAGGMPVAELERVIGRAIDFQLATDDRCGAPQPVHGRAPWNQLLAQSAAVAHAIIGPRPNAVRW
jgi:Flp pilus assembly CpaE family ATPase